MSDPAQLCYITDELEDSWETGFDKKFIEITTK